LWIHRQNKPVESRLKQGYAVAHPETKTLLLVDPKDTHIPFYLQYMDENSMRFGATFLTSGEKDYSDFIRELRGLKRAFVENYQAYSGFAPTDSNLALARVKNSDIIQYGDYCLCFLQNECLSESNSVIALTEVTSTSTKHPILFPGEFFFTGTIGNVADPAKCVLELYNMKQFPAQTMVAPKYSLHTKNMEWIKLLDPMNRSLQMREKYMKEKPELANSPGIGFMMEEKLFSPYFQLTNPQFQAVFGTQNEEQMLEKLKAFEFTSLQVIAEKLAAKQQQPPNKTPK
jgi:hypothetical protein